MFRSFFPFLYALGVILLLWQAFRAMSRGFKDSRNPKHVYFKSKDKRDDRTGRLTIHPELLDQEGRITEEELLTVRFSGDIDPPQSAETSAE